MEIHSSYTLNDIIIIIIIKKNLMSLKPNFFLHFQAQKLKNIFTLLLFLLLGLIMHIGEIVSLHIGGAGCAVGDALWRRRETSNFPPEFFQEEDEQSYRPRAVFADLDPCVKETVRVL